jgi:3-oxoacyl-[acyl-carrier protein] reductase
MDDQPRETVLGSASTVPRAQRPVVLVTGASAGIGDAVVRRFAAGGYRIVAVARRADRLDRLARDLSDITDVATLAVDVTEADGPDRSVACAIEAFGRLDCLVNNAGSGKWAPVHETDDAVLDEVVEISLKAPFRFCRAALRVMKPGASIVNIGSTFGMIGGLDGGAYCVVKAGLIGLTQTLAAQYGAQGIRSNCVAPHVINTDMTAAAWDMPAFRRLNHEMTPIDREGTVLDVANAVYFLASAEGGYVNGQTLALDGGWSTTKYLFREALMAERVGA